MLQSKYLSILIQELDLKPEACKGCFCMRLAWLADGDWLSASCDWIPAWCWQSQYDSSCLAVWLVVMFTCLIGALITRLHSSGAELHALVHRWRCVGICWQFVEQLCDSAPSNGCISSSSESRVPVRRFAESRRRRQPVVSSWCKSVL